MSVFLYHHLSPLFCVRLPWLPHKFPEKYVLLKWFCEGSQRESGPAELCMKHLVPLTEETRKLRVVDPSHSGR